MTRTQLATLVTAATVGLGAVCFSSFAEARSDTDNPTSTPTWSYLCIGGHTAADVMTKANQAGAKGWEMVAASAGARGPIWCFRQPAWARPSAR